MHWSWFPPLSEWNGLHHTNWLHPKKYHQLEPKNHPIEKESHLPSTSIFWVQQRLIFQGVNPKFRQILTWNPGIDRFQQLLSLAIYLKICWNPSLRLSPILYTTLYTFKCPPWWLNEFHHSIFQFCQRQRLLELSMNRQTRKALVQSATQASRLRDKSVTYQQLAPLRCVAFFQASQSNTTCTCNTFLTCKFKCWFTILSYSQKGVSIFFLNMHPRVAQNSSTPGASLLCCWLLLHLHKIMKNTAQPKSSVLHLHETYLFLRKHKKKTQQKRYVRYSSRIFLLFLVHAKHLQANPSCLIHFHIWKMWRCPTLVGIFGV